MLQSHVIDIDGAFVGAAIRQQDGFRFVAVDVRLDELDGKILPSLDDVRRQARTAYLLGHRPHVARTGAEEPCLA